MTVRTALRTARRAVGVTSAAAAIALLLPLSASAADLEPLDLDDSAAEDTVSSTVESVVEPTEGPGPVDDVLDAVEDGVDTAVETVTEAASPAPEPVPSTVDDGGKAVDDTADAVTGGVREAVGEPDDDEDAPAGDGPAVPLVGADDRPRTAAGDDTSRPQRDATGHTFPRFRSGTSGFLPGLAASAAPRFATDLLADPLARAAEPELAAPATAAAPSAPVVAAPELPAGIRTEVAVAALLLVVATAALLAELGPQRATA